MNNVVHTSIRFAKRARYLVLFSVIATACGGGAGSTSGGSGPLPSGPITGNTGWQSGASSRQQASEPFSFVAYGDSRAGTDCADNAVHMRLVQRMVADAPTFAFHLGDMVAGGRATTNWVRNGDCTGADRIGSLKSLIAPLQTRTPPTGYPTSYFPVLGNHDDNWGSNWYPDPFGNGFCDLFDATALISNHTRQPYYVDKVHARYYPNDTDFYTLACSKDPTKRDVYADFMYYSFNFRNSHFVILRINNDDYNLEECGGASKCNNDKANYDNYYNIHQLDWLKNDLAVASADTTIKNIFVFLHTPLFTSWNHPPNASRPLLLPEFSKHKVRIVFSGHNHIYERTVPILATPNTGGAAPTLAQDNVNGTTYVVTGGGGSPLDTNYRAQDSWVTKEVRDYHYVRISVNADKFVLKTIDQNGVELDTFAN